MRAMKDSGIEWIGKIPSDWNAERLGYYSDFIVPMRDKPTSFDGNIPWIRIEDFDGMYISKSKSNQNVTIDLINEMNLKVYPIGTVLCSCSCNLGQCAITTAELCSNQTFIGIVTKHNLNNRYLYYFLSSSEKRLNYLAQGTIQSYLSQDNFGKLKIAICDLNTQKQIADYLDAKCKEIDTLVAAKEKTNALLKEQRQSIIYEAVTKGLDPSAPMKDSGIAWIGNIPKDWTVFKLKHLLSKEKGAMKAGPFGSSLTSTDMQGHDTKVFTQRNVLDNDFVEGDEYISLDKASQLQGFVAKSGDVLITTRGTIGKAAVVPDRMCGIMHPCIIKMILNTEIINQDLLCIMFNDTNIIQEQLRLSSNATTIEVVYTQNLADILIPVAPKETQDTIKRFICEKCAEIDSLIAANKDTINKLIEYRQSIIYEAVTGKAEI